MCICSAPCPPSRSITLWYSCRRQWRAPTWWERPKTIWSLTPTSTVEPTAHSPTGAGGTWTPSCTIWFLLLKRATHRKRGIYIAYRKEVTLSSTWKEPQTGRTSINYLHEYWRLLELCLCLECTSCSGSWNWGLCIILVGGHHVYNVMKNAVVETCWCRPLSVLISDLMPSSSRHRMVFSLRRIDVIQLTMS